MNILSMKFLETAVTGVVGMGERGGSISRCAECRLADLEQGPCAGFGEGCLVRKEDPATRPPACS